MNMVRRKLSELPPLTEARKAELKALDNRPDSESTTATFRRWTTNSGRAPCHARRPAQGMKVLGPTFLLIDKSRRWRDGSQHQVFSFLREFRCGVR